MKRLFVSESAQQPLVNWTMALADFGLALVLTVLAVFIVWRLVDLFKRRGLWADELAEAGLPASTELPPPAPAGLGSTQISEGQEVAQ